mgnify:FL=1
MMIEQNVADSLKKDLQKSEKSCVRIRVIGFG